MKRLLRRAFNLCAAASAMLFIATCALWVRSYHFTDGLTDRDTRERNVHGNSSTDSFLRLLVVSQRGRLLLGRRRRHWDDLRPGVWKAEFGTMAGIDVLAWTRSTHDQSGGVLGLYFSTDVYGGSRQRTVVLPDWMLALPLLAAPAAWVVGAAGRWRARRRRRAGRCEACGYELRESPQRCPECGRPRQQAVPSVPPRSARGPRLAAAVVLVLSGGAAAALAWWSDPARGATAGNAPPWEPAQGPGPDRMLRRDPSWGDEWYQTLWHRPDVAGEVADGLPAGDLVVVLEDTGITMFSEIWNVTAFDRAGRAVGDGVVRLPPSRYGLPCRLVEFVTRDPMVPPEARGRWVLAVQCQPVPHDESDPENRGTLDDRLWFRPVTWKDGPDFSGSVNGSNANTFAVRSAEP